MESITAEGKFWNYNRTQRDRVVDNGKFLHNPYWYAAGPCAEQEREQCRFEARDIYEDEEGNAYEVVIAQGKYWRWKNFEVVDEGLEMTSIARYRDGPCRQVPEGQCEVDTLAYVDLTEQGLIESIQGGADYHDPGPQLSSIRDPKGNVTTFDYDGSGLLKRVTGPSGRRWLELAYNEAALLKSVTDHTSRSVSYTYDDDLNLTKVQDRRGLTWSYVYSGETHLLHDIQDPDNKSLEKTFFDATGRAVRQEDGLGQTLVTIDYSVAGQRTVMENGQTTTDSYDSRGVLVRQVDAEGEAQNYSLDGNFNREAVTDARGNSTRYLFEKSEIGQVSGVIDAQGKMTRYEYDGRNNLVKMIDNYDETKAQNEDNLYNLTTGYAYDAQNNLLRTTNTLGDQVRYTYNAQGQVTSVTDELNRRTSYTYDDFGNRTSVREPLDEDAFPVGTTTRLTSFGYDNLGCLVETVDPLGKVTRNVYDAGDNLIEVIENVHPRETTANFENEYNLSTRYVYDGRGRQIKMIDPLGRVTQQAYDAAGRLSRSTVNVHPTETTANFENEYNLSTGYVYDQHGRQIEMIDPLGRRTNTVYDAVGRVARTVVNYGDGVYDAQEPDEDISTRYGYDAAGNLVSTMDVLGRERRTTYDVLNRPATMVENYVENPSDPTARDENLTTSYAYDLVGNQVSLTDALGRVTTYEYDALRRVSKVIDPLQGETMTSYDAAGQVVSRTDPEGRTRTFAYDQAGRRVNMTDDLGGETVTTYDAVGNRLSQRDANAHTTTFDYDSLYRLLRVTDAENQTTSYTYDAVGNRLSQRDAATQTSTFSYDSLNRLIKSKDALNGESLSSYDALGNVLSRTDPNGNRTTFSYDDLNRLSSTTDPNGLVNSLVYDGVGRRIASSNGAGETTTFAYDGADRLILTRDPLGNETQTRYDQAGQRIALVDAEAIETHYAYDALGRLTKVIENVQPGVPSDQQTNVTTTYSYDKVGNRLSVTNARGSVTTYTYDDLNRLEGVTDPLNHQTSYTYDAVGNLLTMTDANGEVTTYTYDDVNRLRTTTYSDDTPDVRFTYNAVGNRLSMTDGTGTTRYSYDELHRLTQVTDGAGQRVGYAYDAVGNRTQLIYSDTKTVSYAYDAGHRLDRVTTWDSQIYDYSYDGANRLTKLSLPNGTSSSYTYDLAGRLSSLSHSQGIEALASYAYTLDAVGNRVQVVETVPVLGAGPYVEQDGLLVMEAENGSIENKGTETEGWFENDVLSGASGGAYLDNVDRGRRLSLTDSLDYPSVSYPIKSDESYYPWVRAWAADAAGDSLYLNTENESAGLARQGSALTGFHPRTWFWSRQTLPDFQEQVRAQGKDSLTLRLREDGIKIDKVVLATDPNYVPTGEGPAESPRRGIGTIGTLVRTIVYTYDGLYRLTEASYSTGEGYAYSYDALGNRETQTVEGVVTRYQYDAANRLTHVNGLAAYIWDDKGNLLNDGTRSYTYDAANRLIQISQGGQVTQYRYNGLNERTSQTVSGVQTTYTLDSARSSQVIAATTAGQTQIYLSGLAQYQSATWLYHLPDGLGSLRQLSDAAGAIVLAQSYDPFGKVIEIQGNETSPYGYLGHLIDPLNGLIYVNGRYYDPLTGRFLTADQRMPNPYVPLSGTWWIVFPAIGVVLAWRRRKDGVWRGLMMLWVMSLGMMVTNCGGGSDPTATPIPSATALQIFRPSTATPTVSDPLLSITSGGVSGQLSTYTPTPSPSPTLPPTVTPCPTPTYIPDDEIRITGVEVRDAGGILNYLHSESDAMTMARVAMSEAPNNREDRKYVMWVIKKRALKGFRVSAQTITGQPLDTSTIKGQAFSRNQFVGISTLLNSEQNVLNRGFQYLDPSLIDQNCSNISDMVYPCDHRLSEFRNTLTDARNIFNASLAEEPEDLQEYDSFRGLEVAPQYLDPPGQTCDGGSGRVNSQLLGEGTHVYLDCQSGV